MDFFVIEKHPKGESEHYRTDFEYDDAVSRSDAPTCPECGLFVGMLEGTPPFQVHFETWGNRYGDFAFWMSDFLVTKKVYEAYRKSSLTGLSEFSATEIVSHANHGGIVDVLPEYFRTIPQIGSARIDIDASGVVWKDNVRPTCACCLGNGGSLMGWRRIVIDEASWNGDDIFYAYGIPGELIATLRFIEWAEKHQFRNFHWEKSVENSHAF